MLAARLDLHRALNENTCQWPLLASLTGCSVWVLRSKHPRDASERWLTFGDLWRLLRTSCSGYAVSLCHLVCVPVGSPGLAHIPVDSGVTTC